MYGLPACYWLIDEGEEKDSNRKKMERERQTMKKKMESINHPVCSFLFSLTLEVKTLMTEREFTA